MDAEVSRRFDELERLIIINGKEVLSVRELALYLGKSEKTIYNCLDDIPHYKNGVRVSFRKSEINDWLCQVKHTPITINQ